MNTDNHGKKKEKSFVTEFTLINTN